MDRSTPFHTELELPASLASAAAARRFVRERSEEWQLPVDLDSLLLMVSELVTNAVEHTDGTVGGVRIALEARPRELRVDVMDSSRELPVVHRTDLRAASGRGLFLVESLASAWGVVATAHGKSVWFCLDW